MCVCVGVQPEFKQLSLAKHRGCKKWKIYLSLADVKLNTVACFSFFIPHIHSLTHSPPRRPPEAISPRKTRVFKATQFTLSRSGNKVRENGEVEGWLGYQVEGGREGWAWEGKMDGWGYVEGGWVIKNKAGNSETVCVREKNRSVGKEEAGRDNRGSVKSSRALRWWQNKSEKGKEQFQHFFFLKTGSFISSLRLLRWDDRYPSHVYALHKELQSGCARPSTKIGCRWHNTPTPALAIRSFLHYREANKTLRLVSLFATQTNVKMAICGFKQNNML